MRGLPVEVARFCAVIVGAGHAGGRAVKVLREAGFKGSVTLIGAEPHLPYERPPLSKEFLQVPGARQSWVLEQDYVHQQDIQVRLGCSVTSIDRGRQVVILDDASEVAYDRLLLATGANVRQLSIPGYPTAHIHYLRTIADAQALERRLAPGQRVAIIGGGFIGLEVAASARARGCEVVVLEAADRLLPRLGSAEASEHVLRHHVRCGIDVRLCARLAGSDGRRLQLSDGGVLDTDLLVAGIGVSPNIELASRAQLATDDGIVTDEHGRTSDPNIFAAGDVTRQWNPALGRRVRLESWQNANLQAEAAARSMMGLPPARCEPPWVWSDQGSLNLQVAGAPAEIDRTIVRHDDADGSTSIFQFLGERLVGGITLNRAKEMALIRRVLTDPTSSFDPSMLADASIPLRRAMRTKAQA
jgi:NADPH-dependent 2,4-dienoyl-CoA reductase/sulfur reductase-like enzyme